MRDSFVFYGSWWEAIKELPVEIKAEVMEAIMEYALHGEQLKTDNVLVKAIFVLIKPQIDTNNKRYENGMKGGQTKREPNTNQSRTKVEPKPNQNITKREPNVNQSRTKVEPNDNVYDNDNVYVYDDGEEEENKEEISPPPPPQEEVAIVNNQSAVMPMATLDEEIAAMLGNAEWVEATRMRFHVRDPSAFETMLQDFRQECFCRGLERHDNIRDAMSHFCNWLMKKQEVEQEKKRKDENSRRDNCSKKEANRYAIEQLAAAKQRAELGIDNTPNPF